MFDQVPGTPPLSGARHSSARCKPEPPPSEIVYEVVKVPPGEMFLGLTSKKLIVGGVRSAAVTVTLMGPGGAGSFLWFPALSKTCVPYQ